MDYQEAVPAGAMRICLLIKGSLENAVPIISVARHLAEMGHVVSILVGSCRGPLRTLLRSEGIKVTQVPAMQLGTWVPRHAHKLMEWWRFRTSAWESLREHPELVYVGSADTAIALWGLLRHHEYILHLREIHDAQPLLMRALGPIARRASHVVVPEINRAHIYRYLLSLHKCPTVVPNKPFSHPGQIRMNIDFLPADIRERIASRKCLIYQGQVHRERDLRPLLRALAKNQEYAMVVMGRDHGLIDSYRQIHPGLIYIPFVAPPLHLNVTSWAHVGLIAYDNLSLNTVYCAPNKIWEYSGFGLPMLCSENLGLRYSVGAAGAAVLADLEDDKAVDAALRRIEAEIDPMRQRSFAFFQSVDVGGVLRTLLREPEAVSGPWASGPPSQLVRGVRF